MLVEVKFKNGETVSEVTNIPYDIMGVHTPASASGVAGPYTVHASPAADKYPQAVTYDGAALPDLVDDAAIGFAPFMPWAFYTLTASAAATADTSVFVMCRDFHR